MVRVTVSAPPPLPPSNLWAAEAPTPHRLPHSHLLSVNECDQYSRSTAEGPR